MGKGTIANLKKAATQTRKSGEFVDVMHYHISHSGEYKSTWPQAENYFRRIMRYPDSINFVTVLREPRSHLLSCYYFYIFPECELSIEEYLMDPAHAGDENQRRLRNPLSAEFGVKTTREMNAFIENHLPGFKLVMLTERMDESLAILRRLLGWHMIDVTYASLNETRAGARRYDGKPLTDRPDFCDLSKEVQARIDELTILDQALYDAGKKEFEKRLTSMSTSIQGDLVDFQELQDNVCTYLEENSSSAAREMYRSMDAVYTDPPPTYPF
ncbi:unnamed protein product [Ectocarpus fasciculatus]